MTKFNTSQFLGWILCGVAAAPSIHIMASEPSPVSVDPLSEILKRDEDNKGGVPQPIKDEIARIDLSFGLDLFRISAGGVGLKTRYDYSVKPAYHNGNYLRGDSWSFGLEINAGTFLEEIGAPYYFTINRDAAVHFYRQFANRLAATKSLPKFGFKNIPINSKLALENINPGEVVEIPLQLNFAVGAHVFGEFAGLETDADAHYLITGEMLTQFYRMKNNHIRVRLIAKKQAGTSLSAGIRFFKIDNVPAVDHAISRVFTKRLLRVGDEHLVGKIFFVDYVFDLNNPETQAAYDELFQGGFKFATEKIFNPISDEIDLSKMYFGNFENIEKIALEDTALPANEQRISRVFKGISDFQATRDYFDLGGNFARFYSESDKSQHEITSWDADNSVANFVLSTATRQEHKRAFWGLWDESHSTNISFLFNDVGTQTPSTQPAEKNDLEFSDLILTTDIKEKTLRSPERIRLIEQLNDQFSPFVLSRIDLSQLHNFDHLTNLRAFYRSIFHKPFLDLLSQYTQRELLHKFVDYVDSHGGKSNSPELDCLKFGLPLPSCPREAVAEYLFDIASFRGLQNLTTTQAMNILRLRRNNLFRHYGQGFLMSLIPEGSDTETYMSLEFDLESREAPKVELHISNGSVSTLESWYDSLQTMQALLESGGLDLRLIDQEYSDTN